MKHLQLCSMVVALVVRGEAQTPVLTQIANAAMSTKDSLQVSVWSPNLSPRSIASVFGTSLATGTASSPTWVPTLAGTELHLIPVDQSDNPTGDSEIVANVLFVSPTQINFLVPDFELSATCQQSEGLCAASEYFSIAIVRDGQRFNNLGPNAFFAITQESINCSNLPAIQCSNFHVGTTATDFDVVFQTGYDCLFSYSLIDPGACGLSWSPGQHRGAVGAITDALSGILVSPQNPVRQGQLLNLWMTGLFNGVTLDSATGLMVTKEPTFLYFGIAQLGYNIVSTMMGGGGNVTGGTFATPMPLWAGESPQLVGLDQINVAFPTCTGAPATTEKRYDAFLMYDTFDGPYGTLDFNTKIYIPFVIRSGDIDCFPNPVFSTTPN